MRPNSPLFITLSAALALSACSQKASEDSAATASEAAAPADPAAHAVTAADQAGPGIGGAVAPGVAFAYRYAFTLPGKTIADIQQKHAAACEKLGPTHCRVTGMSYQQPREGEVDARIDFLLSPDLAHRFGSDGIAAVEAAAGKLDNASVEGENAGDAITLSQANSASAIAEVDRLEARLKANGLAAAERTELTRKVEELREQLRGESQDRRQKEAAIATTPVSFAYVSEGMLGGNTFGKAASASWSSAASLGSLLLLFAGVALPWLLLAMLIGLLWRSPDLRRVIRRLFGLAPRKPAPTP